MTTLALPLPLALTIDTAHGEILARTTHYFLLQLSSSIIFGLTVLLFCIRENFSHRQLPVTKVNRTRLHSFLSFHIVMCKPSLSIKNWFDNVIHLNYELHSVLVDLYKIHNIMP